MRVGSLFTGVGGFDLGLECAGFDVAWQVESDRWCQQVLRRRWPDVDLYGDVKDVGGIRRPEQQGDGRQDGNATERRTSGRGRFHGDTASEQGEADGRTTLAPVDLICGGFPCQDLSVAGKREGLAGERSGLFFEFIRIADSVAPRWVLVENVPGLLSSNDGKDFAVVLGELTGFHPDVPEDGWNSGGFCEGPKRRCFWRVLDTQHFGPPQRRRRVFLVCDSRAECGPEVLLEPESVPGHPAARREAGEGTAGESARCLERTCGDWSRADGFNVVTFSVNQRREGRLREKGGRLVAPTFFHWESLHHEGIAEGDLAGTIKAGSATPSIHQPHVYPTLRENWRNNSNPSTEARMLAWQGGKHTTGYQGDRAVHPEGQACTLPGSGANNGGGGGGQILGQSIPRRLTPRECERLQGFPDDWTATGIDADGEHVEVSDTQRYKQMGNAVSVPVAAWIGSRIVAAEMGAI